MKHKCLPLSHDSLAHGERSEGFTGSWEIFYSTFHKIATRFEPLTLEKKQKKRRPVSHTGLAPGIALFSTTPSGLARPRWPLGFISGWSRADECSLSSSERYLPWWMPTVKSCNWLRPRWTQALSPAPVNLNLDELMPKRSMTGLVFWQV